MIAEIQGWQVYLGIAITGIFTGLGSALGNYLAQKHIIENMNKIENKLKNGTNRTGTNQ